MRPAYEPFPFDKIIVSTMQHEMYAMMRTIVEEMKSDYIQDQIKPDILEDLRVGLMVRPNNFVDGIGLYAHPPTPESARDGQFLSLYTKFFNALEPNPFTNARPSDDDPERELRDYLSGYPGLSNSACSVLSRHFLHHLLNDVNTHFHRCNIRRGYYGPYFECLFFDERRPKRGRIFNMRVDVSTLL